jgi:hypothetical protein
MVVDAKAGDSNYERKLQLLMRMAEVLHLFYEDECDVVRPYRNAWHEFQNYIVEVAETLSKADRELARRERASERQVGKLLINGFLWACERGDVLDDLWRAISLLEGYGAFS